MGKEALGGTHRTRICAYLIDCKFEFIILCDYYEVEAIPTSGSLLSASLEEFSRPGERGVCAFSSKSLPFVTSVLSYCSWRGIS